MTFGVYQFEVVPDRLGVGLVLTGGITRDPRPAGRLGDGHLGSPLPDVEVAQADEARRFPCSVVDVDVNTVCLDLDDRRPQARAAVLGADDLDERCGDGLPLTGL